MVRRLIPLVADNQLRLLEEPEEPSAPVAVGSEAWYRWLAAEQHQSFAFRNHLGTFTVRRERQRHGWYWYIYRKQEGKLRKAYVGKTEEVTVERLNAVAATLVSRGELHGDSDAQVCAPRNPADHRAHSSPTPISASAYFDKPERSTKHNLPAQPTPLIGREQDVETVRQLLTRMDVRLLTLTGVAGVGKTRLALQVAAELIDHFTDGVFLVALAPVSDPGQVMSAIAQALAIGEASDQPLFALLQAVLKEKQLLLLLDNFEQVASAALQVAEFLVACPRLKVLVTSRVVLHVRAEHEFTVPPLSVPNLERLPELVALVQYEAVALFIERALAVKPDFAVTNANAPAVAGICARLDGLPLAIELAAARIKYFPPQALLARLEGGLSILVGGARDLPLRQQTLRGALAWSYDLLEPEEQQLFRRLAVFVHGCTWQAAAAVCSAAGQLEGDILEGLASLVDKSLLRQEEQAEDEARFGMLQVLREFGLEALASMGETKVTRTAHALYFLALAEQAEPHLKGAEQVRWLTRLELEQENLRASLTFLLEQAGMQQGTEQALRLGAALEPFWRIRRYLREGRSFLEQALASSEGAAAALRVRALLAAGDLTFSMGDLERAEALSQQSLVLSQEVGDRHSMATSLHNLGRIAWERSAFATARDRLEEAEALFQQVGDIWTRGRCLTQLARVFTAQGEYDQARLLLEESLRLYRALGDQERIGWVLYLLASVYFLSQSDLEKATALAEQSLALVREVGYTWGIAYTLRLLGRILLARGETARARMVFEESAVGLKEEWAQAGGANELGMLAQVVALQGDLVQARDLYQQSLALLPESSNKQEILFCLEGLAAVMVAQGEQGCAARLWGAAEALREATGAPLAPVFRADHEQAVAAARALLGEQTFARVWAQGRATPIEQIIDQAIKTKDAPPAETVQQANQKDASSELPPHAISSPPSPPLSSRRALKQHFGGLTSREREVAQLVALGKSNRAIADELVVGVSTVEAHISHIFTKLGFVSRAQVAAWAVDKGLAQAPQDGEDIGQQP